MTQERVVAWLDHQDAEVLKGVILELVQTHPEVARTFEPLARVGDGAALARNLLAGIEDGEASRHPDRVMQDAGYFESAIELLVRCGRWSTIIDALVPVLPQLWQLFELTTEYDDEVASLCENLLDHLATAWRKASRDRTGLLELAKRWQDEDGYGLMTGAVERCRVAWDGAGVDDQCRDVDAFPETS